VSIGLDLGSTQFRSLRYQGDRLVGRTCRAQILSIQDTPAHRRLLDHDGVQYAQSPGMLHILGDATVEWSQLMSLTPLRLLPDGQLPQDSAIARQVLSVLLDAVLPQASIPGMVCGMTIPGELMPDALGPERDFFSRLVRLRGYHPQIIGQGHAIALAELGAAGFSGLGISLGASLCEFSLNRTGREIARCSIPWGLDEVLEHLPLQSGMSMRMSSSAERALGDFLVELFIEAGSRIGQHDGFRVLKQPVAIAIAGGLTSLPQMERLCEQAWLRAAWPLKLQAIRLCPDAAFTIARGCLVSAVLEAEVLPMPSAAAA
jgi:hypothetical protein